MTGNRIEKDPDSLSTIKPESFIIDKEILYVQNTDTRRKLSREYLYVQKHGHEEETMSFSFIKKLPTPEEIRSEYPVDASIQALKEKRDQEIRDVFTGKSDKFLAIIGPCSADNEDAVIDYLLRLRKVQDQISDKVLIIPRVYTNKPRTTGEGYKGMVHQPDPEKKPNMLAGLVAIRKMHIHAIQESGLPVQTKCCIRKITAISQIFFPM